MKRFAIAFMTLFFTLSIMCVEPTAEAVVDPAPAHAEESVPPDDEPESPPPDPEDPPFGQDESTKTE